MIKFTLIIITFIIYDISLAQDNSLTLNESITIGEFQSDSTGYIFSYPRLTKVDSTGAIYISEQSDNSIRKFNKNGVYQNSIGGRGRGPGNFLEITDFYISRTNSLIVLDRLQSRVSVFDSTGLLINEYSLPGEIHASVQFIFPSSIDDTHILAYINLVQEHVNGHFLHLYDNSFRQKIEEYFNLFNFYFDSSIPIEERLSKSPRYFATTFNSNHLAIVPYIYTGAIATFDTHQFTTNLLEEPIEDFYEELNWERRDIMMENGIGIPGYATMSGRSGNFFLKMKAAHFGLVGNRNFLLQFYGMFNDGLIEPWIAVFSSDGEILFRERLESELVSFVNKNNTFAAKPLYLDEDNKLYIADPYYKDSHPAIRVFETNLDEFIRK